MLQVVTLLALWYGPAGGAGWGFVGGFLIDAFSDAHWGLSALALTVAGFVGGFAVSIVQPNRIVVAAVTSLWVALVYFVLLGALLITFDYRFSFGDMRPANGIADGTNERGLCATHSTGRISPP